MITYIDKSNAEAYSKLFSEASARLKLLDKKDADGNYVTINSIDDYLTYLSDLSAVTKFVRLPVDEDVFEINANTRTITVPKNTFAKNGIGIVGDEYAEIVYFKINRFFDIVDLAGQDMNIYIQWENANGDKGASKAYAIDVETEVNEDGEENDYIYFGWALSSAISKKAGNIKFNVRILKFTTDSVEGKEVKTLAYSFNTQTATVKIVAGLNYDFTTDELKIEDSSALVASRFMEGTTAHAPVIDKNLESVGFINNDLQIDVSTIKHENGVNGANHTDSEPVVTYKWYYKEPTGTVFNQIAVSDTQKAITINAAGEYYVTVFATYEIVDSTYIDENGVQQKLQYHTSTANVKSCICLVPKPEKVEILKNLSDKFIIEDTTYMEMKGGQQEPELSDGTKVKAGELEAIVYRASDRDADNKLIEDTSKLEFEEVDLASDNPVGTIVYGDTITNAAGEEEFVLLGNGSADDTGREIHIKPTVEGYYRVAIRNKLNNFYEDSELSNICRVTYPAKPVVSADHTEGVGTNENMIIWVDDNGNPITITARKNPSVGSILKANYEIIGSSDEISLIWKLVTGNEKDVDPLAEGDSSDETVQEGKNTFVPTEGGKYYLIVTNKLNGTEAVTIQSNVITVNN